MLFFKKKKQVKRTNSVQNQENGIVVGVVSPSSEQVVLPSNNAQRLQEKKSNSVQNQEVRIIVNVAPSSSERIALPSDNAKRSTAQRFKPIKRGNINRDRRSHFLTKKRHNNE